MRFIVNFNIMAILLAVFTTGPAWGFAREFNQNDHPGVFQPESAAKLCLFVRSRQGILMIQPHCMASTSSHSTTTTSERELSASDSGRQR